MRSLQSALNRLHTRLRVLETLPIANRRRRLLRCQLLLRVLGLKRRQIRVQRQQIAQHAWETNNLQRAYDRILAAEAARERP
jgi:hypothetical protein